MTIQLVVFDMAGTTVNDENAVNRTLRDTLEGFGLAVGFEDVNRVMGIPKPEALRVLIEGTPLGEPLRDRVDAIHDDFVSRMIRFYATDASVHEVLGTTRTFEVLRAAGVRVALNSGFSRQIARIIMDRLGWSVGGRIDASVTSDEVPRGRPHPDMIRRLMADLGVVDPSHVAKVGDTPSDLLEGRNAGCGLVIGVTRGSHTRQELELFPHTHLIDSVADVPAVPGMV